MKRRSFISTSLLGAIALPATAVLSRAARSEDDTTAKAIAYVSDATKVDAKAYPMFNPGQDCSNCKLYSGDEGAPKGVCDLVLGQYVLAKAWCKSWEPRPAK